MNAFRVDGRTIDLDALSNYFLLGATSSEVAFFFGVDQKTLERWILCHPEIAAAAERGQALADAQVAKSLFRKATGYVGREAKVLQVMGEIRVVEFDQYYAPDANAAQFWLRKRRPDVWGDAAAKPEGEAERATKADGIKSELESRLSRLAPGRGTLDLDKQPIAGSA